jgi:hypothetical protein
LAFENANKYCRQALCPHRRKVFIQDVIRICSDIGAHHIQGVTLTAALKEVIHPSKKKKKGPMVSALLAGSQGILQKNATREKDSPPVGLEWCHPFLARGPVPLEFAHGAIEGDTEQMSVIPRPMLRATPYRNRETSGGPHPRPIKQ